MLVTPSIYQDALLLLLGDNSDRSKSLVKEFLEIVDKQNAKKEIYSPEDELVAVYRSLIKTVVAENITLDNQSAAKTLLLKVKTNETLKSHPVIRDILTDILSAEEPISATQIDEYLKKIRNSILLAELDSSNRILFAKTKNISETLDSSQQEAEITHIKQMVEQMFKNIDQRQNAAEGKKSESYVSLSDRDSIQRSLTIYHERKIMGVVKTGLQGLNKALGERGGFGLGESWVFAACTHHYKSGMLVSIMLWTAIYNKFPVAPNKKALIYFVSLENEVNENLMDVFKVLYCRIEKKNVDFSQISIEFITDWLFTYFSKFDVELIIDRYSPHEFSFRKFTQRYNHFEDSGYQMILFDLDYMSEAKGVDPGDTMSGQGQIQLIKENYLKFTNHAKSCGYLLTTGHQLNREAEKLAAGTRYAVKKFNPGFMADSSDVNRIVDGLFFLHLEKNVDGFKFLTAQCRKNRGNKNTQENDKFFAYPFTEFGIEDDLNDVPQYVTDIDAWNHSGQVTDDMIVDAAMF